MGLYRDLGLGVNHRGIVRGVSLLVWVGAAREDASIAIWIIRWCGCRKAASRCGNEALTSMAGDAGVIGLIDRRLYGNKRVDNPPKSTCANSFSTESRLTSKMVELAVWASRMLVVTSMPGLSPSTRATIVPSIPRAPSTRTFVPTIPWPRSGRGALGRGSVPMAANAPAAMLEGRSRARARAARFAWRLRRPSLLHRHAVANAIAKPVSRAMRHREHEGDEVESGPRRTPHDIDAELKSAG